MPQPSFPFWKRDPERDYMPVHEDGTQIVQIDLDESGYDAETEHRLMETHRGIELKAGPTYDEGFKRAKAFPTFEG